MFCLGLTEQGIVTTVVKGITNARVTWGILQSNEQFRQNALYTWW